ncbi:hypothetical protein [Pantoea agglomerans]|uniref:hypothetical protein n=1 Tax=Enterobacter agglomerans TaxID=549 RepID=UPI002543DE50|nr:hypothetical protein [Pantoea agglomerans]MDK4219017.1 hypothetical protein [Pantoea agglomerans]
MIRRADTRGIPIAVHYHNSQLVSLAMSGTIHPRTLLKFGCAPLMQQKTKHEWWGDFAGSALQIVQWYGNTFDSLAGAVKTAGGLHCSNQSVVENGMHLLMQLHLEMRLTVEYNSAQLRYQIALCNLATNVCDDVLNNLLVRTASMHIQLEQQYVSWMQSCH